tara:strand:- start:1686 stop:2450 length:765 start_codon:yes stop_codon:yes gene_type:complete
MSSDRANHFWSLPTITATTLISIFCIVLLLDQLLRPGFFIIQEIQLEGTQYRVDPRLVERTAWRSIDGNFFSVNLDVIEQELRKIPGVYRIAIRRVWPGTLHISIVESEGMAKWLPSDANKPSSGEQWLNLPPGRVVSSTPKLSGPSIKRSIIMDAYLQGMDKLWSLDLEISAVDLSRSGDWTFKIQSARFEQFEFTLIVGRHEPLAKLADFADAYQADLWQRSSSIESIDLRYPSGFAVRWNSANLTFNDSGQ